MESVFLSIQSSDYVKYIVNKDLQFYCTFDELPPINEANQNVIQNVGVIAVTHTAGAHGSGGKFLSGTKLSQNFQLKDSASFSLGFWLNSTNIKPHVSRYTNLEIFYRMPLFDMCRYTYDVDTDYNDIESGAFCIFEECYADNKNALKIVLFGADGNIAQVSSQKYEVGILHHFFITYSGSSQSLILYIDGNKSELTNEYGTQIPKELYINSTNIFGINNNAVGYRSYIKGNTCILDDVVLLNSYVGDDSKVAKIINYSAKFICNDRFSHRDSIHNIFAFDDPSALGLTAVHANGKNVYAAKSDGSLYKGDQLLWQKRLDFADRENFLFYRNRTLKNDAKAKINYTGESLEIFRGTIKF